MLRDVKIIHYSSPQKKPFKLALIDSYKKLKLKYKIYDFLEAGSDERQYNYPGVDLGITVVCRSMSENIKNITPLKNFSLVTKVINALSN